MKTQSMVRDLKPQKIPKDDLLLLGVNDQTILSVLLLRMGDDPDPSSVDESGFFLVGLLAVRIDAQGQGFGRQMLDLALTIVEENRDSKPKCHSWPTLARIESTNEASKRLFRSRGFAYSKNVDEELELWAHP
ncbi:hypothetical protein I2485_01330 [Nesterenkonia sp. E16_7]|uniref:GNAT family N-acetyltransferase n=1 Tax=unclassified Nesterenkonia TaxID=2629769 RepID=UPI001A92156F|nr:MULTISPECIES: GNAT family N-acetyltransferase [unclassified Nesterenkonia]MBO0594503.1 hypothetical protein [Nesterenkonia sp. E16_10]MBO0597289.1 hypothetical protein [Nesterenkonia sp. E16_7]